MNRLLILLATLTFTTTATHAHPGAVDKRGGHVDKKTGQYHTHKKPAPKKDEPKKDTPKNKK